MTDDTHNSQIKTPQIEDEIEIISLEEADEENSADIIDEDSGEESVSGQTPELESDDDVLVMSQEVGLRLDEDDENPRELNMAADIEKAERSRRGPLPLGDDEV